MSNRRMERDDGVWTESVNGGSDVWSSSQFSSSADHLVVMVNGILGSATDWKFAADQFVRTFPDKMIVHRSERNVSKLTLDGVDVMGERLAQEVVEVIQRKPEVRKISFIAHSIGGLVARYAIGRLYRAPRKGDLDDLSSGKEDVNSRSTIAGLEAMNFITVASPHLGSRGNKQVPFLFGVTVFEKAACNVIHWIFRRTGKHLFLTDNDEGKCPLLQRMVDDDGDLYFMSALRAFRRRVVYSNVGYDHIVGWRTSSIRRNCELPKGSLVVAPFIRDLGSACGGLSIYRCPKMTDLHFFLVAQWEDSVSERYPHIVYEEHSKANDTEQSELVSVVDDGSDVLEEKMVAGLSCVSWEKVDVSFHSIKLRFAAHSVIQVKDHFMHSEGADVILHMIDHFLT